MADTFKGRFLRRRRLIINKRFQYYMIALFFSMSLLLLLTDLVVYQFLLRRTIDQAQNAGMDSVAAQNFIRLLEQNFPGFLLILLGTTILVNAVVSILVSHHIAGPIYRSLQVMQQLTQRIHVRVPVRLRSMDCFPELEGVLNELITEVQKDRPPLQEPAKEDAEPTV